MVLFGKSRILRRERELGNHCPTLCVPSFLPLIEFAKLGHTIVVSASTDINDGLHYDYR